MWKFVSLLKNNSAILVVYLLPLSVIRLFVNWLIDFRHKSFPKLMSGILVLIHNLII